ncbi:hypothetical protein [Spiroplasma kunkelii]|uniref:hypothetical protein n=1 Tax=Spiroplasma kunkelii TaxID=47834 RepID=UPI000A49F905|nr:hypothetical protein [Spiroplasma kunkelii]
MLVKNKVTRVLQVQYYKVQKVNKISIKQFNKDNIGSLKTHWYSGVPDLTKNQL